MLFLNRKDEIIDEAEYLKRREDRESMLEEKSRLLEEKKNRILLLESEYKELFAVGNVEKAEFKFAEIEKINSEIRKEELNLNALVENKAKAELIDTEKYYKSLLKEEKRILEEWGLIAEDTKRVVPPLIKQLEKLKFNREAQAEMQRKINTVNMGDFYDDIDEFHEFYANNSNEKIALRNEEIKKELSDLLLKVHDLINYTPHWSNSLIAHEEHCDI